MKDHVHLFPKDGVPAALAEGVKLLRGGVHDATHVPSYQEQRADLGQADLRPRVAVRFALGQADVVAWHARGGVKGWENPRGEVVHLVQHALILGEVVGGQHAADDSDVDPVQVEVQ